MSIKSSVWHLLTKKALALNRAIWVRKVEREKMFPEAFASLSCDVTDAHKRLFGPLIGDVNCLWLEHYCRLAGYQDARFVPEDVFFMVIERCLNREKNGSKMEDKNGYSAFIPTQNLPRAILRYDYGNWFDGGF